MDIYEARPGNIIELGKRGTHLTRTWKFDVRKWFEDYPTYNVYVLHQRTDMSSPTPVSYFETRDGYTYWLISSGDVAVKGYGKLELVMLDGEGKRAKSETWFTYTEDTICPIGDDPPLDVDPPEPQQGWVEDVLDAADQAVRAKEAAETARGKAEDAQQKAEAAAVHGPVIGLNENWWIWDQSAEQYVDTQLPSRGQQGTAGATGNGIASAVLNQDYTLTLNWTNGDHYTTGSIRGAQGLQGVSIVSVTKTGTSGLTDTYTILFSDGNSTTFQVTNGNAQIDDTAGAGDTTKVWSADKSASKVSELNSAINSAPTEATGQEMLEAERVNTVLEGVVLDEISALIEALPSDETLMDIYVGIRTENEWLDVIHHEVAARLEETA